MERVIKKDDFGDIACNNIIIFSTNKANIGRNISADIYTNWKVIKPEYYKYIDDNTIIEIWYNGSGMILDNGLSNINFKGYISKTFTTEKRQEISYEEAMQILGRKSKKEANKCNEITNVATAGLDPYSEIYYGLKEQKNNEQKFDYAKSIEETKRTIYNEVKVDYAKDDMVDEMSYTFTLAKSGAKQNNNGGASDWYSLPKDAKTLQDLIEHRNMNGSVKDIFKACYRLGIKTEDELRDLNKMAYYSLREIGRITGSKDYITIAKELMGSQADEKK